MPNWSCDDDMVAHREGWGIFDNSDYGIRIERIDDMANVFPEDASIDGTPLFESDEEAIYFVRTRANTGSAFHQRALDFVRNNTTKDRK